MTVVLDEDASHQITLTREGEIIIGVNPVLVLPYVNGRSCMQSDQTCNNCDEAFKLFINFAIFS